MAIYRLNWVCSEYIGSEQTGVSLVKFDHCSIQMKIVDSLTGHSGSIIWLAYVRGHICFRKWTTGRTGHSTRGRGPGRPACRRGRGPGKPACRRERRNAEDGCNGSGGGRGCLRHHGGATVRRMN